MKKYFAKGKTVAATAMAALLVSTTAFAAEKPQESIPATEILTIEEAQALEALSLIHIWTLPTNSRV